MSDYLLLLIKDLDYFSQLQIKKQATALEIGVVDIDETVDLCTNIAETLIFKFNKTRLKFLFENRISPLVKLITDNVKLKQIVINLISKAIKFTNEGFVKLLINQDIINNLEFEIRDTGVGLTQGQIVNIHTPFNKGSGCENNKYGTGLGIYIVTQMLIQLGEPN